MNTHLDLNDRVVQTYSKAGKSYLLAYHLVQIKRFLIQTSMIAIFQYLTIVNLPFSYPAPPLNPSMGIAFTMFYLFGTHSFVGLFLGCFAAYFLKGLDYSTLSLYLTADLGCGLLGAYLCRSIFSTDLRSFTHLKETIQFVKVNALIICPLSAFIRLIALFHYPSISWHTLISYSIELWLADVNAILVLSGFLFSWVYVPFSREKVFHSPIKKIPFILTGILVLLSLSSIKQTACIYALLSTGAMSIYLAYHYGHLVATLLLFVVACIYVTYFIAHQALYLHYLGLALYTLIPFILLIFTLGLFYLCYARRMLINNT